MGNRVRIAPVYVYFSVCQAKAAGLKILTVFGGEAGLT